MSSVSTLTVFAAMNRREKGKGTVVFRRDGDAYSLSNGVLSIHGEMCGERLAQSVKMSGRDCGTLDVLLKVADGAVVIDSTELTIDEVLAAILDNLPADYAGRN